MSENDNNSKPDESKTAHAQDAPDRADTEQASVGPESEERVDPILLQLLVCPLTKTRLKYDPEKNELISKAAGLAFPIKNGVPLMIEEAARQLED